MTGLTTKHTVNIDIFGPATALVPGMIFFTVLQKALVSSLWLSINFLLYVCFALFTEFVTRFRIDLYASQSSSRDDFLAFLKK